MLCVERRRGDSGLCVWVGGGWSLRRQRTREDASQEQQKDHGTPLQTPGTPPQTLRAARVTAGRRLDINKKVRRWVWVCVDVIDSGFGDRTI
jgi:hypothetical protein